MIEISHAKLSIRQQCELLNLNRSNWYYQSIPESEENVLLMKLMDEEYTHHPFKGVLRMQQYLRDLGHEVNEKRVRRLLRLMGIEAIYLPKEEKPQQEPS